MKKESLYSFVTMSVLLHVVVFMVFNRQVAFPKKIQPRKPTSLKAYLYTQPEPKPAADMQMPETELLAEQQPIAKVEDRKQLQDESKQTLATQIPEKEEPVDSVFSAKKTALDFPPSAEATAKQELRHDVVDRSLRSLRSAINQQVTQQAFNEFAGKRSLSVMDLAPKSIEVAPKALVAEPVIKAKDVDCSNAAAETITMLSGLFGGVLKCQQTSPVTGYIERRLNKENVLDGN